MKENKRVGNAFFLRTIMHTLLKTNLTSLKFTIFIGDTSSNGCFSIVILVSGCVDNVCLQFSRPNSVSSLGPFVEDLDGWLDGPDTVAKIGGSWVGRYFPTYPTKHTPDTSVSSH